jgi:hypothetical protein
MVQLYTRLCDVITPNQLKFGKSWNGAKKTKKTQNLLRNCFPTLYPWTIFSENPLHEA